MPSFQAQAVAQALQLVFVLAGGALLLRALALPDVRRRWFQTNRLAHWHVSPAEVGLLVVLVLGGSWLFMIAGVVLKDLRDVLVVLFGLLVQRAFAIGRQALLLERVYGGLVAQGIGIWIAAQVFIHVGVNLGVLPTKGLTLPLMSYGGSALLLNMVAIAIVLRVDYENRQLMKGGRS